MVPGAPPQQAGPVFEVLPGNCHVGLQLRLGQEQERSRAQPGCAASSGVVSTWGRGPGKPCF